MCIAAEGLGQDDCEIFSRSTCSSDGVVDNNNPREHERGDLLFDIRIKQRFDKDFSYGGTSMVFSL